MEAVRAEPEPVRQAQQAGYEGESADEAQEWLRAVRKGLDMGQPARTDRAQGLGFDTSQVLYRGDAEPITAFDLGRLKREKAVMFTNNAEEAEQFGPYVRRYYVRGNIDRVRWRDYDDDPTYTPEVMARIIEDARASGTDGVQIRGIQNFEHGPLSTTTVIFDPANIRSINAAFDPDEAGSSNLLAGVGAPAGAIGLGMAAAQGERERVD
jgi:hypothetical protein